MTESVTIKFRYTLEEFAQAWRLHYAASTNVALELVFLAATAGLGWGLPRIEDLDWMGKILLLIAALWGFNLVDRFVLTPDVKACSFSKLKEEMELTFSSKGVHVQSLEVNSNVAWRRYSWVLFSRDWVLLYYGDEKFSPIPKRAFANADAFNTFERLVTRFVPNITRRA